MINLIRRLLCFGLHDWEYSEEDFQTDFEIEQEIMNG